MAYAVLHIKKFKSGSGAIGAHIDRKTSPANVIKEKSHLNRELIPSRTGDFRKDVDLRISEGYSMKTKTGKPRKLRSDAVKSVGLILSGSHERMKELEAEGKLDEWIQANFDYALERFGKENLIRFTVHLDEKTPHIHCVFVPIHKGNLRFKAFFDGKKDLEKEQTIYAEKMAKFGLNRGKRQSPKRQLTTKEYYAFQELDKPIEIKTGLFGKVKEKELQENQINAILKQFLADLRAEKRNNKYLDIKLKEMLKTANLSKKQFDELKNDRNKVYRFLYNLGKNPDEHWQKLQSWIEKEDQRREKKQQRKRPNRGRKL